MSIRTKALFAIVLAQLLWSTAGLAKIVVRELDPFTAGFLRFFTASLIILPFFLREKKPLHALRRAIPFSLFGAANMVFYFTGLQTSTANAASLIYAAVPLVTALLARRIIHEEVSSNKIAGIVIGLAGVVLIALLPLIERGESVSGNFPGNIFFVLAVFVWSFYLIGSRHASTVNRLSPLTISSVLIFISTALFLVMSVFTFKFTYIPIIFRPQMLLLILHLGLVVSVLTFTFYQWGIKHTSASTASLSTYLGPVFSITINIVALGEIVTPLFLVGAGIVFIGLLTAHGKNILMEARSWIMK